MDSPIKDSPIKDSPIKDSPINETRTLVDDRHQAYASGLTRQERLLLELRDLFYDGLWDGLRDDLKARKNRQPFIIKLNSRIEDDLDSIAKLEAYEKEHGIDLRPLLPPLS